MDAPALCIRLLTDVSVLLVVQLYHSCFALRADAAFPHISPNRLQFFEYENFTVNCEEFTGLTEWRVMRNLQTPITPAGSDTWNSSASSCSIYPSFKHHSGAYWCEDAEGRTSGAVNITVTDGSVILDLPARPVVEGHDVVLHCLKEKSESEHNADFYKDGFHPRTWYKGAAMMIQNVSTSDEGLYRCKISGAGESPESRLAVLQRTEDTHPPLSQPVNFLSLLWTVVLVAPLLLVMGFLLSWKDTGLTKQSEVIYSCCEPDVSRDGTKPHVPDKRVYSSVYYRPLTPD